MFYSQFILAKKGPLGTIWIAAHLERKLRKNQVADTDIGVSVDSILFPDVPIALRLSSHLLLGVVRIYSRKVNYLFDDCSEALLKVKQAFRSTAVDLPPEESTAPYHSITLPETFDLDDFELPDNDIFQGNYVDHHISTREQITLQDTMEGVVYSTSQFGLDERFGDGDTSQAGLDLEEELLLDKAAVTGHDEVSENDAQMSVGPIPHPETHANRERGSSEDMPLNVAADKIPDLAEDFEAVDYADAPCTPGLVEPNVHSVKEGLACDDHLELEDNNNSRELMGKTDDMTGEPSCNHLEGAMELSSGKNVNHNTLVSVHVEDNYLSGEPEKSQAVGGEFRSEAVTTKDIPADESVSTPVELAKSEDKGEAVSCNNARENDNVEIRCDIEVPHSNGNATATSQSLELTSARECVNVESEECQGLVNCEISNDHNISNEQTVSTSSGFLRPCNSNVGQLNGSSPVKESFVALELKSGDVEPSPVNTDKTEEGHVLESSAKGQGEECHASDGIQSEDLRTSGQTLTGKTLGDGGEHAKESGGLISEDVNTSMTSELPAPEKLLSAPTTLLDEPHDMLVETPIKEVQEEHGGSEDGTKITGKKRSFAESALTVQSLNSINSFGVAGTRGTAESIPDDDDLLSSILVGRKSSFLKIKPSPSASEVPSKRTRPSASRPSALKRKVLMDDSMVLHGDTIRQQLTSTEDIRRLRKKAPCTNTEISTIQRQFLEEEIFNVPVLTGISVELTHLHNEAFDLSCIRVCENVDNIQASLESGDVENIAKKHVNEIGEIDGGTNVVTSTNDPDEQPPHLSVQNVIQQDKDGVGSHDIDSQENRNCTAEDNLGESIGNEECRENLDVAAATNSTAMGVETLQSELLSGEISQLPADHADQSALTVDAMQMDTLNILAATTDIQLSEEVPFMNDTSNVLGHEDIDAVDQSADRRVLGTAAIEETKISALDVGVDGSAPNDDVDASLADVSALNDGCCNFDNMNLDQNLENAENDKNRGCSDDVGLVSSEGINDKDQIPNSLCNDGSKMDPTHSVGVESDVKDSSINHEDHVADPLHQLDTEDKYDIQGGPSANDTEFLNVDDDEIDEDEHDGMPNTQDTRLLENTGWSSRTRAVARYLQTLFDKEAENRRKGLSVDSLLAGKTRKEASRMFFETLVLKTRDYIQVEQPQAFAGINIKPRSRLMKSDF